MARKTVLVSLWVWTATATWAAAGDVDLPPVDARWDELPHTDTVFKPTTYASLSEWEARRARLREQIRFAVGLWPEPVKSPLNPIISDRVVRKGYSIEKVYFESYPGFYVTGNLYRPVGRLGKCPAVACPHGHWAKGRLQNDEHCSVMARCITLARLGAVVFSYDMIGFGDSKRLFEHKIDTPRRSLWGISAMALQTWNSIRVLDFLESLPEVDPTRIGVTGASGGGTQTFILSAIDDRVTVAAPVCMVSSIMQGGCPCENAPALRIETNNMEIAACFAPKPMLLVSASGDWTRHTPTVEYPMIRGIYELYGFGDRVENAHFEAKHNYNLASRTAIYRFFGKHLLKRDDADAIAEDPFEAEPEENLLVFGDGKLPNNALTMDQLEEALVARTRRRIASLRPNADGDLSRLSRIFRIGLQHAVCSVFPAGKGIRVLGDAAKPAFRSGWLAKESLSNDKVFHDKAGFVPMPIERYYIRTRRPVRALHLQPRPSSRPVRGLTICVHPDGVAAADHMREFVCLNMTGKNPDAVVFLEPFGTAANKIPSRQTGDVPKIAGTLPSPSSNAGKPRGSTRYFSTFNRTDAAETIYDILTALGALLADHQHVERANVIGFGEMGLPVLLARTLIPEQITERIHLTTVVDMQQAAMAGDDFYLKHLYLPNIQRIGGLRAAAAAAATGPLWLCNVGEPFPTTWVESAAQARDVRLSITHESPDFEAIADWVAAQKRVRQPTPR